MRLFPKQLIIFLGLLAVSILGFLLGVKATSVKLIQSERQYAGVNSERNKPGVSINKIFDVSSDAGYRVDLEVLAAELLLSFGQGGYDQIDYNNLEQFKYMAVTWKKLSLLSESDLFEIFGSVKKLNKGVLNQRVAKIIYLRLVRLNPEEAIIHAKENFMPAVDCIVSEWGKSDPINLVSWLENQKKSDFKDKINSTIANLYLTDHKFLNFDNFQQLGQNSLNSIESINIRKKTIKNIYFNLRESNSEIAEKFIQSRDEFNTREIDKIKFLPGIR